MAYLCHQDPQVRSWELYVYGNSCLGWVGWQTMILAIYSNYLTGAYYLLIRSLLEIISRSASFIIFWWRIPSSKNYHTGSFATNSPESWPYLNYFGMMGWQAHTSTSDWIATFWVTINSDSIVPILFFVSCIAASPTMPQVLVFKWYKQQSSTIVLTMACVMISLSYATYLVRNSIFNTSLFLAHRPPWSQLLVWTSHENEPASLQLKIAKGQEISACGTLPFCMRRICKQ